LCVQFCCRSFSNEKLSDSLFICSQLIAFRNIAGNTNGGSSHLILKTKIFLEKVVLTCQIVNRYSQINGSMPHFQIFIITHSTTRFRLIILFQFKFNNHQNKVKINIPQCRASSIECRMSCVVNQEPSTESRVSSV